MGLDTDNDRGIVALDFSLGVDMRPSLSTPSAPVSETEVTHTDSLPDLTMSQDFCPRSEKFNNSGPNEWMNLNASQVRDSFVDEVMSWQDRGSRSLGFLNSRPNTWMHSNRDKLVLARPARDNPNPVPCESVSLKDHFQARFGERLHHRFKLRRSRYSRLTKILEAYGPSASPRSELILYSGGRSRVVGRGHAPRSGRSRHGLHHLGCHRLRYQPLAVTEDGKAPLAGMKLCFRTDASFSVDRTPRDEHSATASVDSAADIISRLSLNEDMKSVASVDNGMGMRLIEHEKLSIMFEAPVKQPEVPTFEVSKLSLI